MSTEKVKKVNRCISVDTTNDDKKGDGTMSAVTQNCVYSFGKKYNEKKEPTVSREKLKEIEASMKKYLSDKK